MANDVYKKIIGMLNKEELQNFKNALESGELSDTVDNEMKKYTKCPEYLRVGNYLRIVDNYGLEVYCEVKSIGHGSVSVDRYYINDNLETLVYTENLIYDFNLFVAESTNGHKFVNVKEITKKQYDEIANLWKTSHDEIDVIYKKTYNKAKEIFYGHKKNKHKGK